MLGGDPKPNDTLRRPLTEIENRLIGRLVAIFLSQLKESWENIVELDLKVDSVESNPQLVQIVPPNEVVILVGFELMLAQNRGMLNLCIPFNTIENYNAKLSRNGWVGYGKGTPTDETKGKITSSMDRAPVDVVVTLARSKFVPVIYSTSLWATSSQLKKKSHHLWNFQSRTSRNTTLRRAFKGKKAVQIKSVIEKNN